METLWGNALWRQYSAAIDMFEQSMMGCPDALWTEQIWPHTTSPEAPFPPQFSMYWYVSYHTLVWLDIYLQGIPEENFAPPAPFLSGEIDSAETTPEQPYDKATLRTYLVSLRQKCHDTLTTLTEEQAARSVDYPWTQGQPVNYLELLLYTLRHVQEHAAQMSLFLGQHGVSETDRDWASGVQGDATNH
jgi:hypothetical protein